MWRTTFVNGYHVAGNDHVAIAVHGEHAGDAHYFVRYNKDASLPPMSAYYRAIAWTSAGI